MTAHEVLCGVLNLIDSDWGQQPDLTNLDNPPYCLFLATYSASKPHGENYPAYEEAVQALAAVIGCEPDSVALGEWNDAPERTFDEVRTVVIAAIRSTAPEPDLTWVEREVQGA